MTTESLENLLTIKQFVQKYPAFRESVVRGWIFRAEENGFRHALRRVGGRIYLDVPAVVEWIEGQNGGGRS